jgi:hypothetical protein
MEKAECGLQAEPGLDVERLINVALSTYVYKIIIVLV